MLFNSVFTIFWDFNIQCRICYTACSVNRRETVSLFKFPIKSLMIPFELNWPVSLITIYILYVIITLTYRLQTEELLTWEPRKLNVSVFYLIIFEIFLDYMLVWSHCTFHSSLLAQNRPSCSVGSLSWLYPEPSNSSLSTPAEQAALYESLLKHQQPCIRKKAYFISALISVPFFLSSSECVFTWSTGVRKCLI